MLILYKISNFIIRNYKIIPESNSWIPTMIGYSLCLDIEIVIWKTKWENGEIRKEITEWKGEGYTYNQGDNQTMTLKTWRTFA